MRIAYLDCASGISGDMTLAALIDAGIETTALQVAIDSLGLPKACSLVVSEVKKRGFRAKHVQVEHEPEHAHRHLHHIEEMIDRSSLTDRQRNLAKQIFRRIGEAEAKVHGTTIEKVHFHEVGAVDSIADIVGAAVGWDLLGVDAIISSPIPTGTGFVEIAHGRCSIPAPATAELLRGIPIAELPVEGELTTPTGAAIVATVADRFGPLPAMKIDHIGYGAGTADFPQPNILRLIVGETAASTVESSDPGGLAALIESICLLETNLDDATGEVVGYVCERLFESGALDVSVIAAQMKKGRLGVHIAVQCHHEDADRLQAMLFEETPTLGIRRTTVERRVLPRERLTVETKYGAIDGVGVRRAAGIQFSPEFESCRQAAAKHKVPCRQVFDEAIATFLTSHRS